MTKYLYGAAVQGIQGFIFQTNDLKDVIGASELVEQICTTAFQELIGERPNIIAAAGNIKHVFDSKEQCEKVVREYPRRVMNMAPGITFSQAVVALDDNKSFADQIEQLEKNLRAQRNRPAPSMTLGLIGMKRAPKTGLPAVDCRKGELLDAATVNKREAQNRHELCQKAFGVSVDNKRFAFDIKHLTGSNDWTAIIHADGNGLGQVVQQVGSDVARYREFSKQLDLATREAAQEAFALVVDSEDGNGRIPLRPVVLGGDDLTVIIRADLAVPYAQAFMQAFEQQTRERLGEILTQYNVFQGEDHLTACAGIAFIKSSFPFHYGYHLAEALCDRAKKDAKSEDIMPKSGLAPSCLMFHKVQDSYIESYDDIVRRELNPTDDVSWEFGPYYLVEAAPDSEGDKRWTVDELLRNVNKLRTGSNREEGALKNHVRQWMSLIHESKKRAEQHLKRARAIVNDTATLDRLTTQKPEKIRNCDKSINHLGDEKILFRFPCYDVLSLLSIMTLNTK